MHSFHGALGFLLIGVREETEASRPLRYSIHNEMNFREVTKLLERAPEALFCCPERKTADVQPGGRAMRGPWRLEAGGSGGRALALLLVAEPSGVGG